MIASLSLKGAITSLNDSVKLDLDGYGGVGIRVSGTFTGTLTFQGSIDGTTFDTLQVSTLSGSSVTTTTGAGQWSTRAAGLAAVRVKMTAYTSGTANVEIHATGAAPGDGGSGGGGAGNPAGPSASIQFNDSSVFGGTADLTWNGATIGIADLAAASGLSNIVFADDAGLLSEPTDVTYDPLDHGGSVGGKPLVQFSLPTRVETTRTSTTDQYPGSEFVRYIAPTGNETTGSGAVAQFRSYVESQFEWNYSTCVDALVTMEPGCHNADPTPLYGTAILAVSAWADNKSSATVQAVLGLSVVARMTGTAPVCSTLLGVNISPADPSFGSATLTGTTTDYGAISIHDYDLGAPHTLVTTNRYGIKLGTMAGSVTGGYDYAIYSLATQTSYFTGPLFSNTAMIIGDGGFLGWGANEVTLTHNGAAALTLAGTSGASLIISTANGGGAIISRALIGGSANNSTISIYATAHSTPVSGANIEFAGGNNGATPFGRFLSTGVLELDFKCMKYNAIAATNLVAIRTESISTTKTSSHSNVATVTPPAAACRYRITAVITTTSSTNTGSMQVTVDYRDSQGTTHTADIIPICDATGVYAASIATVAASKEYHTAAYEITTDNSQTNIVVKTVCTGTVSYTDSAAIEQIA